MQGRFSRPSTTSSSTNAQTDAIERVRSRDSSVPATWLGRLARSARRNLERAMASGQLSRPRAYILPHANRRRAPFPPLNRGTARDPQHLPHQAYVRASTCPEAHHFRQNLPIWNSAAGVPLLQTTLHFGEACHAVHSNLRYPTWSLRVRWCDGGEITLDGGVRDEEGSSCRSPQSEKKGATFLKISATSDIRNSTVGVPDVRPRRKLVEPSSFCISRLRLLNSEAGPP